MRVFSLFVGLFLLTAVAFAQYEEGKVLVLKDGRIVSVKEGYEIFDTEVHFIYGDTPSVLPLSKIDLEETRRRNKALAEGGIDAYQALDGKKGPKIDEMKVYVGKQNDGISSMSDKQSELEEALTALAEKYGLWLVIAYLSIGFAGLISFFVNIYIIFKAFQEGAMWGIAMLLFFLFAPVISVFAMVLLAGIPVVGPVIGLLFQFAYPIFVFIFMFSRYEGRRALVLFLWALPLFVAVFWLIVGYFTVDMAEVMHIYELVKEFAETAQQEQMRQF